MRLALLLPLILHAETIDRIAVSVANRVITASDLDRQIRVAAFESGTQPDFSSTARKAMADRMVEYTLIRLDIDTSRYPVPEGAEVEPALTEFRQRFFENQDQYRDALKRYSITEADLKEFLLRQRLLNGYIEVRFRPAVQVTDQDIQDYFDRTVAPAERAAHPGVDIQLEAYRARIESSLMEERINEAVSRWLVEARRRNEIVYHAEAFQ